MTVTGLTTGGAGSESAAVLDHVHVTVKDDGGNIVVDQDLSEIEGVTVNEDGSVTISVTGITGRGTYDVKVQVDRGSQYEALSVTVPLTVYSAVPVTGVDTTVIYDGAGHTIAYDGLSAGEGYGEAQITELVIRDANNAVVTGLPSAAGTYTVSFKASRMITGQTDPEVYTGNAVLTILPFTAKAVVSEGTYNKEAVYGITDFTGIDWENDTVAYSLDGGTTFTQAASLEELAGATSFTEAGIHTVLLRVNGNAVNDQTVTITILPAQMTEITAKNIIGYADGKASYTPKLTGVPEGAAIAWNVNGSWQNEVPVFTQAGQQIVGYRVSLANYTDYEGSFLVKLDAATETVVEGSSVLYDGAAHGVTVYTNAPEGTQKIYYRVGVDGAETETAPSFTDIGSYDVYYRIVNLLTGQTVTQIVTDASGHPVTDEDGQVVTQELTDQTIE